MSPACAEGGSEATACGIPGDGRAGTPAVGLRETCQGDEGDLGDAVTDIFEKLG